MKKLFFSLVAMMVATMSFAQSTLVATLTHGDNISMFYGTYALQRAHAAAVDGDIINLSGGGFQSVKITKALTIRGAGAEAAMPTTINGYFTIEIPTTVTERLSFEGCAIPTTITVSGTLSNAYFLKNNIDEINFTSNSKMVNGLFVSCNLIKSVYLLNNCTVQFINSYVYGFHNSYPETASASFINCLVRPAYDYYADDIKSAQLVNCILWNAGSRSYNSLPYNSSAWNCVAVGPGNEYVFNNLSARQNCNAAGTDIFVDGNPWGDLTDEAKANYLGTDGTPIGRFGGVMPYNMTPSYPQITKMNVAGKTTADGKLSVEIEVSAAE